MKYMGSKARIAKEILPIILKDRKDGQFYVEPFAGGCNVIDKVDGNRIASDNNAYLIRMWVELQHGWIPPEFISRETYSKYRDMYNAENADECFWGEIGYVGFNGSYGGRFYDGGYTGITTTKHGKERNYPLEAYKNVMSQIDMIKGILFVTGDYKDLVFPKNSIIYCDIPYFETKEYKSAKGFNHNEFCDWARQKAKEGHTVYVSEYNMPEDFTCVWEKEVSSSLRSNSVISGDKKSVEKLFTLVV